MYVTQAHFKLPLGVAISLIIFARLLPAVAPAVDATEEAVLSRAARAIEACFREAVVEGVSARGAVGWHGPRCVRSL